MYNDLSNRERKLCFPSGCTGQNTTILWNLGNITQLCLCEMYLLVTIIHWINFSTLWYSQKGWVLHNSAIPWKGIAFAKLQGLCTNWGTKTNARECRNNYSVVWYFVEWCEIRNCKTPAVNGTLTVRPFSKYIKVIVVTLPETINLNIFNIR